jgi:AraC-like DNA-binding protein
MFRRLDSMSTTSLSSTPSIPLTDWPGLGQVLQAPPPRATSYAELLETATRMPRRELPSEVEGDVASGWFRSGSVAPQRQAATEFLRMAPGAWLAFGEYRFDAPQYVWSRERQQRAFCIVLRGGCVFGFAPSPQQRFALTEGHALGIAYGSDTMICRTPLPGVRSQVVSVYFDNDEAMHQFGLDVGETNAWLASVPANDAAPGLRLVASMPNVAARKAAQAICGAPYQGARRRLFLRSKAGEMLCHLMASPEVSAAVLGLPAGPVCGDASLAALAHEFVSDPEHCPDVADVAARLHVSTGRLLSAFRATYGVSLRDHMSATRMALARRLLMQTNTPLLEVTFACGYEHHSSFSTAYRRNFGETPIETRRTAARR